MGAVARAAFLAWAVAGSTAAASAPPVELLDVPFLSQPRALCGGAAVAMVARYWGRHDVTVEQFAHAVGPSGQGIAAARLEDEARRSGLQALSFRGERARVQEHLARGRPLVVLLDGERTVAHYVVLVGWGERGVVYHDPALGPYRVASEEAWEQRWSSGAHWTLLLLPESAPRPPDAKGESRPEATTDTALEQASSAFRNQDWASAARLAGEAAARHPHDDGAWRLLATSRFLQGQSAAALQAWNEVGEPKVELIRLDGLERLRPRSLEDYLGFERRGVLGAEAMRRGQRRLAALAAVQAGRLSYRPLPEGRAEVEVALLERPAFPSPRRLAGRAVVRALAEQTLGVEATAVASGGQSVQALAEWRPERDRFRMEAAQPQAFGLPGLLGADLLFDRQSYALAAGTGDRVERRRRGALWLDHWWTSDLRARAEVAADTWTGRATTFALAGEVERRLLGDHMAVGGRAEGWWSRERPFHSWTTSLALRTHTSPDRLVGRLSLRYESTSARAPLALWPGAGTGPGREGLLRGHPLLDSGVVEGPAFGRALLTATLEADRPLTRIAGVQLSGAVFLDGARVTRTDGGPGTAGSYLDAGAGLRLRLPGSRSRLRLDLAHPWRGSGVRVSAGWEATAF